jgi:hypothetical protein
MSFKKREQADQVMIGSGDAMNTLECGTLWGRMLISMGRTTRKVLQDELFLMAFWEMED